MKSLKELQEIRDRMKTETNNIRIIVGMATCGIAAGARGVFDAANGEITAHGLGDNVTVVRTGCVGICAYEPIVEVLVPKKEKITYVHMNPEKIRAVINSHALNGNIVEEYTYNYAVRSLRPYAKGGK